MGFKEWLIHNHSHRYTAIGDLARDIADDKKFPSDAATKDEIRFYLRSRHACGACLAAFSRAWNKYEKEKEGVNAS